MRILLAEDNRQLRESGSELQLALPVSSDGGSPLPPTPEPARTESVVATSAETGR
jgi:hypothetical protein